MSNLCVILWIGISLCLGQIRPPGCGRPVGDGWHLIRRTANSLVRQWHEATDRMAFTQEYNTNNILQNCVTDAQCAVELTASFSKSADSVLPSYDQVLFASGDCQYWLMLNTTVTDLIPLSSASGIYDFVRTSMETQYECTFDVKNDNSFTFNSAGTSVYISYYGPWSNGNWRNFYFYYDRSRTSNIDPIIYNNGMNVWIRDTSVVNDLHDCYPTTSPTPKPSETPSIPPTESPSLIPTVLPSISPSKTPTVTPSIPPTAKPTNYPTNNPSKQTSAPTKGPSKTPTLIPTKSPTVPPTNDPTNMPTKETSMPTQKPSTTPTVSPTIAPTINPTNTPTNKPSKKTSSPTITPSITPIKSSINPTIAPSKTTTSPSKAQRLIPAGNPSTTNASNAESNIKFLYIVFLYIAFITIIVF